jgi:hypothetical protein
LANQRESEAMAANLTPQYLKAEEEYRRAQTIEDEIKCLEVMLREIPKHKSSEKLQADLKQKLSKAKKELEAERKTGKKGHGVRIPRQGARARPSSLAARTPAKASWWPGSRGLRRKWLLIPSRPANHCRP